MRSAGQPTAIGALAAAQIGVPVAAATLGSQLHLLKPGQPAALILAALVTIVIAAVAAAHLAGQRVAAPDPDPNPRPS